MPVDQADWWPWLARPFTRIRAPQTAIETQRVERVLATARVLLGSTAWLALLPDRSRPVALFVLAYALLVTYLAHAMLVLLLVRLRSSSSLAFRTTLHVTDILWAAAITVVTEGPNSQFLVFFLFALLAAAYRWGFWETVSTAVASSLILMLEADLLAAPIGSFWQQLGIDVDPNRVSLRAMYLGIFGLLLGYLAEEDKRLRAESTMVARIISQVQPEHSLGAVIRRVTAEILAVMRARRALLVVQELATGRVFLCRVPDDRPPSDHSTPWREARPAERESYLFDRSRESWDVVHRRRWLRNPVDVLSLDADGWRRRRVQLNFPGNFLALNVFRAMLSVPIVLGDEWSCRCFVFDPRVSAARSVRLRFVQALILQIAPAVYSVYLFRRLRSRAGAIERARVARELHDGVIQSLLGAELHLDVLRRQAAAGPIESSAIGRVQELVRAEVLNLRDLMQHMRPLDLRPTQLLDFIADLAERFQRDTGIEARFVSELSEVTLSPRVCRELGRIVQEALVNIRKHSRATHVVVSLAARAGRWTLTIDDDGQGFKFSGRLSSFELDAGRKGPVVIKERVRTIGGEISIESQPGQGARMVITLPHEERS